MTEEYEELRIRIKLKMAVVLRELADSAKIFEDFKKKQKASSKKLFAKNLQYYMNALKFNVKTVMDDLDEEVEIT